MNPSKKLREMLDDLLENEDLVQTPLEEDEQLEEYTEDEVSRMAKLLGR